MLVETYGVVDGRLVNEAAIHVCAAGEVYARDDYVYWGFTGESLRRMARHAGFDRGEIISSPMIAGHPRIIARLV